jgi:hypothetical protein
MVNIYMERGKSVDNKTVALCELHANPEYRRLSPVPVTTRKCKDCELYKVLSALVIGSRHPLTASTRHTRQHNYELITV